MKINLKGKIAIVTGGASGIGRACAGLLSENGASVIVADIKGSGGGKQKSTGPDKGCFVRTDVSDPESVRDMIENVMKKYGRIDILVNNAAINVVKNRVNVDEYSPDDWNNILRVDLDGVFFCSRMVSREMIRQKSGRIVNIGSVLGNVPARKQIAYVAAKAAVHNMTRAMALELAPYGILVNAVAPGSIVTAATRALFYGKEASQAEFARRMLSHVPLSRPGEPQDVANAVLFLCGEESRYITGHILVVDGGWTCGYIRDF